MLFEARSTCIALHVAVEARAARCRTASSMSREGTACGGVDCRQHSIEYLKSLPFDGFAIGAAPILPVPLDGFAIGVAHPRRLPRRSDSSTDMLPVPGDSP